MTHVEIDDASPDEDIPVVCFVCEAEIPDDSPAYGLTNEITICLGCATKRGADYDAVDDCWTRPPRVDDLDIEQPAI